MPLPDSSARSYERLKLYNTGGEIVINGTIPYHLSLSTAFWRSSLPSPSLYQYLSLYLSRLRPRPFLFSAAAHLGHRSSRASFLSGIVPLVHRSSRASFLSGIVPFGHCSNRAWYNSGIVHLGHRTSRALHYSGTSTCRPQVELSVASQR